MQNVECRMQNSEFRMMNMEMKLSGMCAYLVEQMLESKKGYWKPKQIKTKNYEQKGKREIS